MSCTKAIKKSRDAQYYRPIIAYQYWPDYDEIENYDEMICQYKDVDYAC